MLATTPKKATMTSCLLELATCSALSQIVEVFETAEIHWFVNGVATFHATLQIDNSIYNIKEPTPPAGVNTMATAIHIIM